MSKPGERQMRPETTVVTAGRSPFDHHGLVNPPVYHASTMLHRTMHALENRTQPYPYGRRKTPTIEALENAIATLEGGAETVTSFLKQKLVDKIYICMAPIMIGNGINSIGDLGIKKISGALKLEKTEWRKSGPDMIFSGIPGWN